jgi:hypothetical protein
MWRRLVFALIGLSLTVVAVHSQSLWRGAGGRTCAQFTEDIKNSPEMEMLYFQWAQGFLSASNLLASYYKEKKNIEVHIADLDALSIDEQKAELRELCSRADPTEAYFNAVQMLFFKLVAESSEKKR